MNEFMQQIYMCISNEFNFTLSRCICKMAIADTRVKDKRGKELLVITASVRDIVKDKKNFRRN